MVDELMKHGVNVLQVKQYSYKYMIVDSRIVWYGGIDILGGSHGEASMIRIQHEELTNELLGKISQ